jgi:hypothetical protein
MNPRERRRWNLFNRNVLIGLIIALIIIAAAYVIITTPPNESADALSPDYVMDNYNEFLGDIILVEGYYYSEGVEKEGVITSSLIPTGTEFEIYKRLPVDYSNVNISLVEEVKYRFNGVLTSDPSIPANPIMLVAEEIVAV